MEKPAASRARQAVVWGLAAVLGVLSLGQIGHRSAFGGPFGLGRAKTRDEVRAMLPFDQLSPQARWKVNSLLDDHSLSRALPAEMFRSDPDVYLFLLNQPQITVAVWQALGISNLKLQPHPQNSNFYVGDDGKGIRGTCEFLFRSPELHVLFCEGTYRGPLVPKPIRASLLLVLRSAYFREQNQQDFYVSHQLYAFVKLESGAAEAVAKLTDPLAARMADQTFTQVSAFLSAMSRWIEQQPEWAHRLADRLPDVSRAHRQQFHELAERTAAKPRYHAMLRGPDDSRIRR